MIRYASRLKLGFHPVCFIQMFDTPVIYTLAALTLVTSIWFAVLGRNVYVYQCCEAHSLLAGLCNKVPKPCLVEAGARLAGNQGVPGVFGYPKRVIVTPLNEYRVALSYPTVSYNVL